MRGYRRYKGIGEGFIGGIRGWGGVIGGIRGWGRGYRRL